jgi:hypothetical protein
MHTATPARLAISALWALSLIGCASTHITTRHDPPYRAEAHTSTISVTATSQLGIDRIVVELLIGELVPCISGSTIPSLFPCRQNGYWQTFTCEFQGSPASATCPLAQTLNTLTMVTYRATAITAFGKSASTNYITYSGGAPPAGTPVPSAISQTKALATSTRGSDFDPPFPLPRPTAADVLRPIWLETDIAPSPTPLPVRMYWDAARRIDIAILPDADWETDYRAFSDWTNEIVSTVYFNPVHRFAQDYTYWRDQFSLWAGPVGTHAAGGMPECLRSFTGWAAVARALTDGQAVIHKQRFQDCSLGGPGWGTVNGDFLSYFTFVHESGHFLYCLGDEYAGAERIACSDPPNTFATEHHCREVATSHSFPTQWCVKIPQSNLWRITSGAAEIMAQDGYPAAFSMDWQDTSNAALLKRIAACLLGACW